jgi:sulfur relay (sulfurtransferase) complex TusBCD TusD component (DsrE family)
MKHRAWFVLPFFLTIGLSAGEPLFINMTADEPHRAFMAISFGCNQLKRGHGLTVFLNDRGVMIASKDNAAKFPEQQKLLAEILAKGGTVNVCPVCMKHYGIKSADLLPGLKVSDPVITEAALFAPGARTLSW